MSPSLRSLQLFPKLLPVVLLCAGCATSAPQANNPSPGNSSNTTAVNTAPSQATAVSTPKNAGYLSRPDVQAFHQELINRRQLPADLVSSLLAEAKYSGTAVRLMTPRAPGAPGIVRDWPTYRGRFVEPIRIERGIAFYERHRTALAAAEKQYGVPASIITAIIGVETLYGQHMGNFRVLDTVTTLAFDYPEHPKRAERVELFRNQLADLIELHTQGKLDARKQLGSFAGAIGIPQFMPTSVKEYAVTSETGRQQVDLESNVHDAILSVANFLVKHGWVRDAPVFAPVDLPANAAKLVTGGLTPTLNWQTLLQDGARLKPGSSTQGWGHLPLGVIDLPTARTGKVQYRVGTPNFFALTHYNRSYFYATAVADLAYAIAHRE